MKKMEVLFPELCNYFGDIGNVKYLKQCGIPLKQTAFTEQPAFLREGADFVYMGAMTERSQERIIEKLLPHKSRISELIESGTVFLFTGNAFEIMGKSIEDSGREIPCLGLLDFHVKRDMMKRYSGLVLAQFKDSETEMEIAGFRAQFTKCRLGDRGLQFTEVVRGDGMDDNDTGEGVRHKNFFGTYLLGPLLVTNPALTKYLLGLAGICPAQLPFEEELAAAYQKRLRDFKDKSIGVH